MAAYPALQFKKLPAARGRAIRRVVGEMNNTEKAYADTVLEPMRLAGEVAHYWFEQFTFKMADDLRYTPDFVVQLTSGVLECHEVKGHWEEDARIKIRMAAQLFPFRFVAIRKRRKKDGGGWAEEEF